MLRVPPSTSPVGVLYLNARAQRSVLKFAHRVSGGCLTDESSPPRQSLTADQVYLQSASSSCVYVHVGLLVHGGADACGVCGLYDHRAHDGSLCGCSLFVLPQESSRNLPTSYCCRCNCWRNLLKIINGVRRKSLGVRQPQMKETCLDRKYFLYQGAISNELFLKH